MSARSINESGGVELLHKPVAELADGLISVDMMKAFSLLQECSRWINASVNAVYMSLGRPSQLIKHNSVVVNNLLGQQDPNISYIGAGTAGNDRIT